VRRAILAGACALALALAGCGGDDADTPPPAATGGRELFTSAGCGSCHRLADAEASGVVGPDLDDLRLSEAGIVRQVRDGGGGMPAFRDSLTEAQIAELARYLRRVAGR